MGIAILLLFALPLCAYSVRHAIRSFREIRAKNASEKSAWKRFWNWPAGMIWSAYLLVFSFGLIVNNLIVR